MIDGWLGDGLQHAVQGRSSVIDADVIEIECTAGDFDDVRAETRAGVVGDKAPFDRRFAGVVDMAPGVPACVDSCVACIFLAARPIGDVLRIDAVMRHTCCSDAV